MAGSMTKSVRLWEGSVSGGSTVFDIFIQIRVRIVYICSTSRSFLSNLKPWPNGDASRRKLNLRTDLRWWPNGDASGRTLETCVYLRLRLVKTTLHRLPSVFVLTLLVFGLGPIWPTTAGTYPAFLSIALRILSAHPFCASFRA